MKPSAFLRRRKTGSNRSWLFDEGREFFFVRLPTHVIRVVVAGPLDHHELHWTARRRGDVATHLDRDEHVGGAVEDEDRTVDTRHRADVIQPQPDKESREDAVMASGHAVRARERRFEDEA